MAHIPTLGSMGFTHAAFYLMMALQRVAVLADDSADSGPSEGCRQDICQSIGNDCILQNPRQEEVVRSGLPLPNLPLLRGYLKF